MLTLKKIHISACTPERLATVLKENQQGNHSNYIALLNMIKSSHINELCILVKNLSVIVAAFDKSCDDIVTEIISADWDPDNNSVETVFKHFLISLLTSQPYYVNKILNKMVKGLSDVGPNNKVVIQKTNIAIIKTTTDTVPSSLKHLQSIINSPHITESVKTHESYYVNMLELVNDIPSLFNDAIFQIIGTIVKIDLHMTQATQHHDHHLFTLEEDKEEEKKLDLLLSQLLLYIKQDTPRHAEWCKAILLTFDSLVLPVYNPCNSPFILFYYFNLYPDSASVLLDYLWSVFIEKNQPLVVRSSAVNYLSMFSSTSLSVSCDHYTKVLISLSTWCHHYTLCHSISGPNGIFYNAVQALCHMFSYRHTELISLKHSRKVLEQLNFGGIIHSPLNPLRYVSSDILRTFNTVTSVNEIVMCSVIIERNNRLLIPFQQSVEMPLQCCSLPLTLPLIAPFYRDPSLSNKAQDTTATLEDWDDMLRSASFSPSSFNDMSLEGTL